MAIYRNWKQTTRILRLCGFTEALRFVVQCLAGKRLVELRVRGIPGTLFARRFHTDIAVLWGAFKKRECDVALSRPPRLIVDGGANVGFTTVFYASKYPDAKVVAVEPDRENFELMRRNCRMFPNVLLMQGGLWNSDTHLEIENPGVASWSFRLRETPAPTPNSVKGITIRKILCQCNAAEIDILKLDIEGAEEFLFAEGCDDWIGNVRTIVIEVHNQACRDAVFKATSQHAFTMSKQHEKLVFMKDIIAPATKLS
jgi:FkbM family methyltransferase